MGGKGQQERAAGLAARALAAQALHEVLEGGMMLPAALARAATVPLAARDRALAENIVRTALRRKGQIEDILHRFLRRPLPRRARKGHAVLLAAAAQILFMRVPAHAAVDMAVRTMRAEARLRPLAGLVNAVLRKVAAEGPRICARQDAFVLDIPAWLRRNWTAAYGETEARKIAAALLEEPALDITVKRAEEARLWAERLGGHLLPGGTVRIEGGSGAVPELPGFAAGAWWVQDFAAAWPARLLGDVRGRRVLDLCAAPGGKTAQLAAAGARVTALDVSAARLRRLEENLARLGLEAEVVAADVMDFAPAAPFDAVLLDAPCTATGTARRHPEVLWLKSEAQMAELAALQEAMLARAATFVRPGGVLVYCTCSLQPQEGEQRAEGFLGAREGSFSRLVISPPEVGGQGCLINAQGDMRCLPQMPAGASRGMDGFFAARFRREG